MYNTSEMETFLFSVDNEPIENKETDNVIKSTIDDKTGGES